MDARTILVLGGYLSLLIELGFFALPSEASTYQLLFTGSNSAGEAPAREARSAALTRARKRPALQKLLLYALPTGLGIVLFLIPPALLLWPTWIEALLPLPALETRASLVLGAAAIVGGRVVTFVSVLQLRGMQAEGAGAPSGLFRHSRNPGLVGMYAFYLGNALLFPCLVLFLGVAPYVLNMHRRVLMEESHLVRSLGDPYRAYLQRVPRYLPGGVGR